MRTLFILASSFVSAALASAAEPVDNPWRTLPLITDGKLASEWAHIGWGGFAVDDGALRTECDERGMGLLLYKAEKFGDCQIRVVYRCEKPKSNAGVYVRLDDGVVAKVGEKSPEVHRDEKGKLSPEMIERLKDASEKHLGAWYPVHHGYEVQIMDAADPSHRTGAIYSLTKAEPVAAKPQGEWRTMIITLEGERITVEVDDERLSSVDVTARDLPPRKNWTEPIRDIKRPIHGYIGLQNHDPGDVVWFKDVCVRSLEDRNISASASRGHTVRVAAISFKPVKFDLAGNADRLEKAFRSARQGGAQIAVAPEGVLEGYVVNEIIAGKAEPAAMKEVAVTIDDPVIRRFQALARELEMCLVFGFAERIGDEVFNCAVFIDHSGRICGKHHKMQFAEGAHPDWWFNRPGARSRAFDTPFGRCGIVICNERWNPQLGRILALDGARFFVIPSFGSRGKSQDDAVHALGRDNGVPVVEANVGVTLLVNDGRIVAVDRDEEGITFGDITIPPAVEAQPERRDHAEREFLVWREQEMKVRYEKTAERNKKDAPADAAADVTLVENGKAKCVIVLAANAPETARLAAEEVRRVVLRATGAELATSKDRAASPAIRIESAGSLPHDGFEIRIEGRDVVIAGNDDVKPAKPDAWFVPSHGTLWGAQEFLERFVGVRWLFPGELGEDVPRRETLRVSLAEPERGAPSFAVRSLGQVEDGRTETPGRPRAAVLEWMRHARLNTGLHPSAIGYGHSWDDYLKPADLAAHPEWKPSIGDGVRNGRVTYFCTTAPGVVETFARRVIESLDRHPERGMASISPTDGGGFCKCERCAKLLVNDPHGKPSHAPAILLFYQQVAEIVARERPGRRLGGYAYYNYAYPPPAPPKLPDNFSLCWAPLNYYGYGLLKPVYRDEFERVLAQWSRVSPRLCYNNHSTWMRSFHGAPLPIAFDVLKLELPAAARNGAWAARLIGTSAWGVNAPLNSILARQMWDTRLDVSAALDDWLARAYGPGWPHMRRLYDDLDARMAAHKSSEPPAYKGSQYEVNEPLMKAIYAPLFPSMEERYRATLAACATETQRRRLAMFGDNLVQLHFALRKAGRLADDGKSIFHRDDADYAQFLKQMENTFSLYRDDLGVDHGPIWEKEYRAP